MEDDPHRCQEAHNEWVSSRDTAVWGEHGLASLEATHWLDGTPRHLDGVPGRWRADADTIVGDELARDPVRLRVGESARMGELLLRAFGRGGSPALRVLNPRAPGRRGISRIERFTFDPALSLTGIFRPARTVASVESADGHHVSMAYGGVVELDLAGEKVELTVDVETDETLFAAFSDATSGDESYRFRFLRLPAPEADGTVEVNLNRAYLPPCAFSDHYVCVFPPVGNRWTIPVRGGERLAV